MSDDHGHDHGHDHPETHPGARPDEEMSWAARRLRAIESLLEEAGVCTTQDVTSQVEANEARSPKDGARVVAKAWSDPGFRERLLQDPMQAIPAEFGIELPDNMPKLEVVENTDDVRHIVVCTLCSCYPRGLLGRPPDWYKSLNYRSRAVSEPRDVMSEFGLDVPYEVEIRVQDSTADLRYLVLPQRPSGTEGWTEDELAQLVTRDSMIGVQDARSPGSM